MKNKIREEIKKIVNKMTISEIEGRIKQDEEETNVSLKFEREEKRIFHNKTIRLPEDVIEKIDTIVQDKNISFNKVVLQLIEYALKDVEQ